MSDLPGPQTGSARQASGPPVHPLSSDQQPATKADLYAAVDAMPQTCANCSSRSAR